MSNFGAKHLPLWRIPCAVYVVAVTINYPWELAQAPLYVGMDRWGVVWWHCLLASLGDGLLVLLIYTAGRLVLRRSDWYESPGARGRLLTLAAGLFIALGVEWAALKLGFWEYGASMPYVPFLRVGAAPVVQMLVLPTLIFRLVAWPGRRESKGVRG